MQFPKQLRHTEKAGRRMASCPGLNSGALAVACGISKGAMSAILNGRSHPHMATAVRMARALGITLDQLWGWLHQVTEYKRNGVTVVCDPYMTANTKTKTERKGNQK